MANRVRMLVYLPRQSLVKGVDQYVGSLVVDSVSTPDFPPSTLYAVLSNHRWLSYLKRDYKSKMFAFYSPLYARYCPPVRPSARHLRKLCISVCVCVCAHFLPYMVCNTIYVKISNRRN